MLSSEEPFWLKEWFDVYSSAVTGNRLVNKYMSYVFLWVCELATLEQRAGTQAWFGYSNEDTMEHIFVSTSCTLFLSSVYTGNVTRQE